MRYIIVCLAALGWLCAGAKGYDRIALERTNGEVTTLAIDKSLSMEVADGSLKVTSPEGSVSIPLDDVKGWSYLESSAAIEIIDADGSGMAFDGRVISFGKPVVAAVYTFDGRLMTAPAERESIDVTALPKGSYVVTAGKQTLKIQL